MTDQNREQYPQIVEAVVGGLNGTGRYFVFFTCQ